MTWISPADELPRPHVPVLILPRVRRRLDRRGDVLVADMMDLRDMWFVYNGSIMAVEDVEWWTDIPEMSDYQARALLG